jgi:hypothetical protein
MAKGRRKLRRQLIKKMKKGYLTPGEREDLMELDREVNRANRQGALMTGAGLGTALAIASKTGALGNAGDALGDWLDQRAETKDKKDAFQEESRVMGEQTAQDVRDEARDRVIEDAMAQKDAPSRLASEIEDQELPEMAVEEEDFDEFIPNVGPLGPSREGFDEWQAVRDRAEALREARALLPTEEQEKWERRERLMDEYLESKSPEEGNMERIVGPGADPYSDPEGIGARRATMFPSVEITPEFSWEDLQRRGGPRVQNEDGGYTPFLRAMRSKIRKKYLR